MARLLAFLRFRPTENAGGRVWLGLAKAAAPRRWEIPPLWLAAGGILVFFTYLAVILDAFSRRVIGYAISRNLDTELTLAAFRMTVVNRNPPPGCIPHSGRGASKNTNMPRCRLMHPTVGHQPNMGRFIVREIHNLGLNLV